MVDYQLSQIAIMHHENGLSQQEIAHLLGFSKMTVSRMLQKAKEQGIIQTGVLLPFELDNALGKSLQRQFDLQQVWVMKNDNPDAEIAVSRETLAKAAAFTVNTNPPGNSTIGIGIGRTVGQFVRHLSPLKTENVHVVQLMGGLPDVTKENPFTIIQETCRKWDAAGTFLTSFATAENKDARERFFENTDIGRGIYKLWTQCDTAVFGIGTIEKGTLLSPSLVGTEEIEKLKLLNAVGDVLGHCFDAAGNFVSSDLEDRLVAIPLDMLIKVPVRMAIAFGAYKVDALYAALRTGVITKLFTDDCTASMLLHNKNLQR